jgi:hypothetical protein
MIWHYKNSICTFMIKPDTEGDGNGYVLYADSERIDKFETVEEAAEAVLARMTGCSKWDSKKSENEHPPKDIREWTKGYPHGI